MARALGPSGKGVYSLLMLVPLLALKLGSLGIEAANVYFTGSRKYNVVDVIANSFLVTIFWGFVFFQAGAFLFSPSLVPRLIIAEHIGPFSRWFFLGAVPLFMLFTLLLNVVLGKERITLFNIMGIFRSGLQLLTMVVFVVLLRKGISGALLSYSLSVAGATLLLVLSMNRYFGPLSLSLNRPLLRDSLAYGMKCCPGTIIQFLNYRIDLVLIAAFLPASEVGFYSIAVGLTEKLWMLPAATASVLFPRISSLSSSEADDLTPKITRNNFFLVFLGSLVLLILVKPAILILFGRAFLPALLPFLILLPGTIVLGGTKTIAADLAGRGRPQIGTYAAALSLILTVFLNLWLIPKWGIAGAAVASSLSYGLAGLVLVAFFHKFSGKPWREIVFLKRRDFQDYKEFLMKHSRILRFEASEK